MLDKTFKDSKLIKSIKVKNDGDFYSYSKVLSEEEINNLVNECEKVIDKAINNILDANFNINPKKIGYDNNIGCEYCKFKDICFKKEEDKVYLEEKNFPSYLNGGDENE